MSWISGVREPLGSLAGLARRDERGPVGRVDVADARDDDEHHDEELDADEDEVDAQGLLDALGDEQGQQGDEEEGREVEVRPRPDRVGPLQSHLAQQGHEVLRPPLGDHARAQHELEEEVPADDPRDELAERRVGEGVGRARDGHRRGELGVAESGEATDDGTRSRRTARSTDRRSPCAARPVSVKIPAPMMTPMPKTVRSRALRVRFSWWSASSAEAIDASIDLVRNTLMLTSGQVGDGTTTN